MTMLSGHRYAFEICTHLIRREFRAKYRRSLFGWLWSVAQPLMRFVVLGIVFGKLLPGGTPQFASFLFSGLLFWQWFSSGVASATKSVLARTDLLVRPGLPRWTIPLTSVLTDLIDLATAFPILLLVIVIDGRTLTYWALLVPVILLFEGLMILGLGMAFCVGNTYFRDVGFLVDILLLLGFYITPVFFSADRVPQHWRWIIDWNPMAGFLRILRDVLIFGRAPGFGPVAGVAVFAVTVFIVGATIFARSSGNFLDEL
jgi:lipopolysaccharide transport system permease protein